MGAFGAVCARVSWRAEIRFDFLGLFFGLLFATAQQEGFQCPGKVRVWAQTSREVASISWGCQNTQQQRAAVAKGRRLNGVVWAWP